MGGCHVAGHGCGAAGDGNRAEIKARWALVEPLLIELLIELCSP